MVPRALQLIEERWRQVLQQDEITHMVVIAACGKYRRAERASQLLGVVVLQGLQPQVTSYAAATSACRKGRITERALQPLRRC